MAHRSYKKLTTLLTTLACTSALTLTACSDDQSTDADNSHDPAVSVNFDDAERINPQSLMYTTFVSGITAGPNQDITISATAPIEGGDGVLIPMAMIDDKLYGYDQDQIFDVTAKDFESRDSIEKSTSRLINPTDVTEAGTYIKYNDHDTHNAQKFKEIMSTLTRTSEQTDSNNKQPPASLNSDDIVKKVKELADDTPNTFTITTAQTTKKGSIGIPVVYLPTSKLKEITSALSQDIPINSSDYPAMMGQVFVEFNDDGKNPTVYSMTMSNVINNPITLEDAQKSADQK